MQNSRPLQFPFSGSSFKKHRSSIDSTRFATSLTLPKPFAVPVWASLPTPPMSGSPPPEPPSDPPQIAGRRRKRSHTPPPTSAPTAAVWPSPPTPLEQSAPRHGSQARGGETMSDVAVQSGSFVPSYPLPTPYHPSGTLPAIASGGSEPRLGPSPTSPRATRKPKAHVASACVNCKKKHLRCDNTRPCRRCVQSGKEETCVDIEHKKRGRPPLKPEDSSARRGFESALSPLGAPSTALMTRGPSSDPAAYVQGQSSRSYRPLQSYGPPPLRPGQQYAPMYAQPSVQLSTGFVATGTFAAPPRPYQPGGALGPGQAPSTYGQPQPEPSVRSPDPHTGYAYQATHGQMGPPAQMTSYSNPIFPRPPVQSPVMGDTLPPLQSSGVQLPPIRPTSSGPLIDPTLTTQPSQQSIQAPLQFSGPRRSPQEDTRSRDSGTQEPDAKRPKMDIMGILGPRSE